MKSIKQRKSCSFIYIFEFYEYFMAKNWHIPFIKGEGLKNNIALSHSQTINPLTAEVAKIIECTKAQSWDREYLFRLNIVFAMWFIGLIL